VNNQAELSKIKRN